MVESSYSAEYIPEDSCFKVNLLLVERDMVRMKTRRGIVFAFVRR